MSSTPPEVQRELVALAHEFAERELRPRAAHYDETEEFPWDVFHRAAEVGLAAYDLPGEYGGGGIDSLLTSCLIGEEMAWGDAAIWASIGGGSFFAGPIVAMGSEAQKRRWIAPLCGPKPPAAALAITEPEAGSDAAALTTHARRVDGGYRLDGQKTWVSNAPDADLYIVFATVAPGTRSKGITAFVLEKGDPGFAIGHKLPKMGNRANPAAELFFEDCFVPDENVLGEVGQGFQVLARFFPASNAYAAASVLGVAEAAYQRSLEWAETRVQGGRPIIEHAPVRQTLARLRMLNDASQAYVYRSAWLADHRDQGWDGTVGALPKVFAAEAAWEVVTETLELHGGYGYMRELGIEKLVRDAAAFLHSDGANKTLLLKAARFLRPS